MRWMLAHDRTGKQKQKEEQLMTALEIKIILAMREASEENLAKALAYLSQIESEEMPAAAPQSAGGAA